MCTLLSIIGEDTVKVFDTLESSESDNEFEVGTLTTVNTVGNKRRAMITLDVGKQGVPTRFLPRDEYVRFTRDESLAMPKQVKPTLVS